MPELTIEADTGAFRRASTWLAEAGARLGIPDDGLHRLDLCLNEALANIVSHGGSTAPIHLCLGKTEHADRAEGFVVVTDQGQSFDSAHAIEQARPQSLLDATPGGLGLLMIRSFSDVLTYQRDGERNQLRFGVRWTPAL